MTEIELRDGFFILRFIISNESNLISPYLTISNLSKSMSIQTLPLP